MPNLLSISVSMVTYNTTILYVYLPVPTSGKTTYSSPKLLFPLIYEIYGKDYPKDSTVVPLSTEYSVERSDTKEISTIKADLTFCVNDADIYHFEYEITYDGQITIRMLEYDLHAALTFRSDTKNTQFHLFPHANTVYSLSFKHLCQQIFDISFQQILLFQTQHLR